MKKRFIQYARKIFSVWLLFRGKIELIHWQLRGLHHGHEVTIYPHCSFASAKDVNLGHHVFVHNHVQFYAAGSSIKIGNYVLIGPNVSFLAANRNTDDILIPMYFGNTYIRKPITVQDDVWFGKNATILAGVTIGQGAVIGANAVVTKDVPPYAIVAGNPAQIIRFRGTEENRKKMLSNGLETFSRKTKKRILH